MYMHIYIYIYAYIYIYIYIYIYGDSLRVSASGSQLTRPARQPSDITNTIFEQGHVDTQSQTTSMALESTGSSE